MTAPLSNNELSRGFAFAVSTELVNNLHCNSALQGEALMMLKEHFIETYGVPKWTLGLGGSGGAIQHISSPRCSRACSMACSPVSASPIRS